MGLTIDRRAAEKVFAKALARARSRRPLPREWLDRTRRVAEAKSKTFTPALGTALLAKATDRRIDAFSLREGEGHKSYSARNLAKEVLVPQCIASGIDIRTTGAEPLNNQPFFHSQKIGPDIHVRENARDDLLYLCESLERADFLENENALNALAAFLRARLEVSEPPSRVSIGKVRMSLGELEKIVDEFMEGEPEGGKIGQALGAAMLDLVFEDVRTRRVNDPGVKWPGDVGVFIEEKLIESVEVKQRPATETEILLFAQRLQKTAVQRALVLAFAQAEAKLDLEALGRKAAELYGVELVVFLRPSELLREAIRWARRDLPASLDLLPTRGLARLTDIEASQARRRAWAEIFGGEAGSR